MKNFYLLPLSCAIAALSACSAVPAKQEIVVAPVLAPVLIPAPAQVVLRKVEPETSAPHYRLNPKNYQAPLNVLLVEQIKEALTPKVVDAATGAVVSRLPLRVPSQPVIDSAVIIPSVATTTALGATQAAIPIRPLPNATDPTTNGLSTNPAGQPDSGLTGVTPAPPEQQNTEQALLEIDPSLKLDEQALAALTSSQNAAIQNTAVQNPAVQNTITANPAAPATTAENTTTPVVNATTTPPIVTAAAPVVLPKILIPVHDQQLARSSMPAPSTEQMDVTQLDKDILLIEGKARHYPTYFTNRLERSKAEKKIKEITQRLDMIAVDPRASYEVLLRAMKAHVLARNMDAGPDSAFKSAVYFQRLLKLKPSDPETSFWYGFSLGEGGGFRESIPHLHNAVKADYQEAYLSLAHSYLQMEDKINALAMLNNYKIKFPTDVARTDQLISEIEAGKRYSIWQ